MIIAVQIELYNYVDKVIYLKRLFYDCRIQTFSRRIKEYIYSKLLTLGGTIDIPEGGIMTIKYDNSVRDKVIDSYIEDGETKEMAQYIVDYFEYIYRL